MGPNITNIKKQHKGNKINKTRRINKIITRPNAKQEFRLSLKNTVTMVAHTCQSDGRKNLSSTRNRLPPLGLFLLGNISCRRYFFENKN